MVPFPPCPNTRDAANPKKATHKISLCNLIERILLALMWKKVIHAKSECQGPELSRVRDIEMEVV
jgi:hypothetical protein